MRLAFAVVVATFALAGTARAAATRNLPGAPPAAPELLFTFDDGPHLERTPRILDVLEKHHIHAVFFVNGMRFSGDSPTAEKGRALLREIISRGHYVGNHTVHHYFLCGERGPRIAEGEIEQNARLIEQAIGFRPELFRTPYGSHCASLNKTLARAGVRHTSWDIDPQDWRVQNTRMVRDYVISHIKHMHGRQIVLMHDIHQCTVEALPQILDWLDKENAERKKRGEPEVRVIDYAYLLPPHPGFPAILDAIGRVLIDSFGRVQQIAADTRALFLPPTSRLEPPSPPPLPSLPPPLPPSLAARPPSMAPARRSL